MRANKTDKQRTPVTKVIREALFSMAQREPNLTAAEMRGRLLREVATLTEERRSVVGAVPGLRACQVIVQMARRSYPLDKDFFLGHEALASIPPEAVPFLLDIYRTCLVTQTPFSVRQALWCVRLRALAPNNPLWVYERAEDYATRERVAKAFRYDFDTRSLDAWLAFAKAWTPDHANPELADVGWQGTGWAHMTAANLGVIPMWELFPPGMTREEETEAFKLLSGSLGRAPLSYPSSPGGYVLREAIWSDPRPYTDGERGDEERAVATGSGSMEPEANIVFALWLGRILHTEKWASLTVHERVAFAQRLREEVVAHEKAESAAFGSWAGHKNWETWQPEELLKEVGIDPTKEQRWVDRYNERSVFRKG